MTTLKRPNLNAERSVADEPFLCVRKDRQAIRVSERACDRLGLEEGDYLHFAFDRGRRPLVGSLNHQTDQGEPQVYAYEHSCRVYSALMCRHLDSAIYGDADEKSIRFYFDGETIEDEKTGATLHLLEVPRL